MKLRRLRLARYADLKVEPSPAGVRLTLGPITVDLWPDTAVALADALIDALETKETNRNV